MAALAALERLASVVAGLELATYLELLWRASLSICSFQIAQEVLLILHDSRMTRSNFPAVEAYAHSHSLAVIFDRAEEASDSCPCDEQGCPKRQKEAPVLAKLLPMPIQQGDGDQASAEPDELSAPTRVMAHIRVNLAAPIRIHSHVRLKVASTPEHSTLPPAVVDAVVVRSSRGEVGRLAYPST